MDEEAILFYQSVIRLLETIKQMPGMYIGSTNPDDFVKFIHGFETGVHYANRKFREDSQNNFYPIVMKERGWLTTAQHYSLNEMRKKNMNDQEILNEAIDIETMIWQKGLEKLLASQAVQNQSKEDI